MLVEKIQKGDTNTVFIYTTCRDWEEARSIGLLCIEKKLAFSSDFWEINSIYPWQGVLQEVVQYMLMLTTEKGLSPELVAYIATIHSYTNPMIAEIDTALINAPYKLLVDSTLHNSQEYTTEDITEQKNIDENGIEKLK